MDPTQIIKRVNIMSKGDRLDQVTEIVKRVLRAHTTYTWGWINQNVSKLLPTGDSFSLDCLKYIQDNYPECKGVGEIQSMSCLRLRGDNFENTQVKERRMELAKILLEGMESGLLEVHSLSYSNAVDYKLGMTEKYLKKVYQEENNHE